MTRITSILIALVSLAMLAGADPQPKVSFWHGDVGDAMLAQVQKDIEGAQLAQQKTLYVELTSPGGTVLDGLSIAYRIERARDAGMTVEIKALGYCMSACTFILASGSPGHRFVERDAKILVHPPQNETPFGSSCVSKPSDPKDLEDRSVVIMFEDVIDIYVRSTGRSVAEVTKWMTCGNEVVGHGEMAVSMGLADKVI